MVSPSSDTGTTYVTLVKVPCCQLSYILYIFKHCDLPVPKIVSLWEAVCVTLYSQNPTTTFKIRFLVFMHGLWRAGSFEHRVIPFKLITRVWKYPPAHQEGGAGTPLKDSKLGALMKLLILIHQFHSQICCTSFTHHFTAWISLQISLLILLPNFTPNFPAPVFLPISLHQFHSQFCCLNFTPNFAASISLPISVHQFPSPFQYTNFTPHFSASISLPISVHQFPSPFQCTNFPPNFAAPISLPISAHQLPSPFQWPISLPISVHQFPSPFQCTNFPPHFSAPIHSPFQFTNFPPLFSAPISLPISVHQFHSPFQCTNFTLNFAALFSLRQFHSKFNCINFTSNFITPISPPLPKFTAPISLPILLHQFHSQLTTTTKNHRMSLVKWFSSVYRTLLGSLLKTEFSCMKLNPNFSCILEQIYANDSYVPNFSVTQCLAEKGISKQITVCITSNS